MIEASPAKLLFQSFGDRDLESREASQQDCRIAEMRNVKHVLAQPVVTSHWSHRRKMEEGASADKLHFGVSGIGTWRVTKSSPRGSRNAEV
jgi:hypothetical protein